MKKIILTISLFAVSVLFMPSELVLADKRGTAKPAGCPYGWSLKNVTSSGYTCQTPVVKCRKGYALLQHGTSAGPVSPEGGVVSIVAGFRCGPTTAPAGIGRGRNIRRRK